MPVYTSRLNLPKPLGTESVNRDGHNALVDAIDTAAAKKSDLDTHTTDEAAHGATSAATANKIVRRDAAGRFKAVAPAAADDVVIKSTLDAAISGLINGAPGALDTLKELADAMGDDPNFAATITNALALKAPLASPSFTGNPTVPTQAPATNNTKAASTAYADAAVAVHAADNATQFASIDNITLNMKRAISMGGMG